MRRILAGALLAGVTLAACRETDSPTAPVPAQASASAAATQSDKYIVVYKPSVTDTRDEISRHVTGTGARVLRVYQYALRGWAGDLTPAQVVRLQQDPHVAFIERDQLMHASTNQTPTPSWGLDRIDQVSLPLNNTYGYPGTGAGVHFYGIDTGILYTHNDFGGRASAGFDAITPGGNAVDCAGHGTHTASTAGGTTYGVAKGMTLIGVRVLDCSGSGSYSQVIAGVDWVTANAIKPAVANMSLGGPQSAALDLAVANSIASGVVYAIASGNGDAFGNPLDACGFSPADVSTAITVNASVINDTRASFSNYGTCTDIYAPGVNITAAWIGTPTHPNDNTNTISGTSMATPHVAGVVGLYLAANPTATPAQVAAALVANASSNKISNPLPNTPNKLLYMGFIGGGGPPNQPPVAHFTVNCPALQCTFDGSTSTDDAGVVSYAWTWGNGSSETHASPVAKKTYQAAGTYSVTLKVTDGGGLTNSITVPVQVPTVTNQPPTASITQPTNNASFVQGASVSFAGSGNDPETGALTGGALVWTSDRDGQIGTGTGFSSTTLSVGTHVITLTATDPQNATGTATRTITITAPNQPPTASITQPTNNASFVQGASVSFAGSGNDPETGALTGGALVWTSDRDGQIGTGTGFSSTTLSVGTHVITLTATDPQNATGTATRTITITPPVGNQPPVAAFTVVCSGLPHQCAVNASTSTDDHGIVSYKWDWGNGKSETHSSPTAKNTWAATGTYNVTLTVTDGGGLSNSLVVAVAVP